MKKGHCACGSLRYRIDLRDVGKDLTLSGYCHCTRCQRMNGSPYVWTSHWRYEAVTWEPSPSGPPPGLQSYPSSAAVGNSNKGQFSPKMDTYETMKGRKWKLRCNECGSPMGSWNAAKKEWTIWPVTLQRKKVEGSDKKGVMAEGEFDAPDTFKALIKADHHQFYGPWRAADVQDSLEKWTGYKGNSSRVDAPESGL